MPNYGSQRCVGCSGEDCVCCEVYLEERASQRYAYEYADEAYYDELDYEPDDDYDDSMDGDFDSGMASAGFGTDEDYNHYEDMGDYGYYDEG